VLQVLVDADNVLPARVQPVVDLLARVPGVRIVVTGRSAALALVSWPAAAVVEPWSGWQRADLALARAYRPSADPLVLITGDGDFGLLAARHPGPVLVISGAASTALRHAATVVDPATVGTEPVRAWLGRGRRPAGRERRLGAPPSCVAARRRRVRPALLRTSSRTFRAGRPRRQRDGGGTARRPPM
jgi:hypothetical protein